MNRTKDLDLELYTKYAELFPTADTPNLWECGSWELVNSEMQRAIEANVPWKSQVPKDAII